jgi:hypothetical protein
VRSNFFRSLGRGTKTSLLVLAGLSSCTPSPRQVPRSSPPNATTPPAAHEQVSADQILLDMMRTYEGLSQYEDTGLTMAWSAPVSGAELTGSFVESNVFFERPAHMQVRYLVHHERWPSSGALYWNETGVYTRYKSDAGTRKWESIEDAMVGFQGMHTGTTHIVPMLLIGKNPWTCRDERPSLEFVGRETVGSVDCLKIKIKRTPCSSAIVWIAESTRLLRKVSTVQQITERENETRSAQAAAALPPQTPTAFRERVAARTGAMTLEAVMIMNPRIDTKIPSHRFSTSDEPR